MAEALKQKLDRIESKADLLKKKFAELRESRKVSESHISSLQKSDEKQRKEIEQLNAKIQYLSLSHTIAPTGDDLAKSRDILAQLVREIDRCIADIGY